MKTSRPPLPGPLVVIGGSEDRTGQCSILKEFVRLAGGVKAHLLVMTVASRQPKEVGDIYVEAFKRLGVKHVQPVDIEKHEQANDPDLGELVAEASGVFFTGGDQVRITNLLGGSLLDRLLHRRHEEGMVLGGTSAG